MKVFLSAISTVVSLLLSSSIVKGLSLNQGLEISLKSSLETMKNTNIPIETGVSAVAGKKSNSIDDGPQENLIEREGKLFTSLKNYVDTDKFLYENYLKDFHKFQRDWQILVTRDSQTYVASVFKAMTKAAEEIIGLFNHDNYGAASVMRNMYQFYVTLLFSYRADKTVDGDVASAAYKKRNLELWEMYKQIRALPVGPPLDLRDEYIELDDNIYNLIADLKSKIPE